MPQIPAGRDAASVRRYRFLGLSVSLVSDRPGPLELMDRLYGRFRDRAGGEPDLSAEVLGRADGPRLRLAGVEHRLAAEPVTDFHAYSILFGEFLARLETHFFLHAAAFADDRRVVLLAGPSGHGKTTLALAAQGRGFRLLSDDFAPLARGDGRVHPFPKRVGLRRTATEAPPGGAAEPVPFGDKWLLDPHALPGGIETEPRRPTHLLLLDEAGPGAAERSFRIALVGDQDRFEREMDAIPGLTWSRARTPGGRAALQVTASGGTAALASFHELCGRFRHRMLLFEPREGDHGFGGPPAIRPLDGMAAALGALRHVLNRAADGSLLRGAAGAAGSLLTELATLLRGVRCGRLRAGAVEPTLDRLVAWLEEEEP